MEAYQLVFLDAVSEESITDIDAIIALQEEFNRLIADNLDEAEKRYAFYVDNGKLLMTGRKWGHIRSVDEDVANFSLAHPELILDFIKRGDPNTVLGNGITDLGIFWRAKFHKGQVVAEFTAAPLAWQDANAMNWYA